MANRAPHDGGIAAEAPLPEPVTQNGDWSLTRRAVGGLEPFGSQPSHFSSVCTKLRASRSLTLLLAGFDFEGRRVPVLAPQGIFKPVILDFPLSITTTPPSERKPRPYNDEFDPSGLLWYRYRGADPRHPDNVGLREVMQRQLPLI